jgi:hypothetical protein
MISEIGVRIVNRDRKFKIHNMIIYIKDKELIVFDYIYRISRIAKFQYLIINEFNFARSRIYKYNISMRYFANYSGAKRMRRRNIELKKTII